MDSDFFGINGEESGEDLNFELALEKKHLYGKKGKMLMEMEKSYNNDKRFELNKNFKGDVDSKLVSKKLKEMSNVFDEEEKTVIYKKEISNEKNKNMNILSSILTNEEFLSFNNKKPSNPKNLIIKRFDPSFNIGTDLIVEKKEEKKIDNEKIIKLEKGINKYKNIKGDERDFNKLSSRTKDSIISKVMNQANMIMETKVEVKFDHLKDAFKKEKISNFMLFGETSDKIISKSDFENNIINTDIKKNDNIIIDQVIESEDTLLNKKKSKTKKKNDMKKLKTKLMREEIKEKIKHKEQVTEKKLKKQLLKDHKEDQVNEYIRLVNLVRKSNKKKINNI